LDFERGDAGFADETVGDFTSFKIGGAFLSSSATTPSRENSSAAMPRSAAS
jgi:hypothetical protein